MYKNHADGTITETDSKGMGQTPYDGLKTVPFVLVMMKENRIYEILYFCEHKPDGMCSLAVCPLQLPQITGSFLSETTNCDLVTFLKLINAFIQSKKTQT